MRAKRCQLRNYKCLAELVAIGMFLLWSNSLFLFVVLCFKTLLMCQITYIAFHHLGSITLWVFTVSLWKSDFKAWFNKQYTHCTSFWYDSRSWLENKLNAFGCMTISKPTSQDEKEKFPYLWQLRQLTRPINTSTQLACLLGSCRISPAVLRFCVSRVFPSLGDSSRLFCTVKHSVSVCICLPPFAKK